MSIFKKSISIFIFCHYIIVMMCFLFYKYKVYPTLYVYELDCKMYNGIYLQSRVQFTGCAPYALGGMGGWRAPLI